MLADIRYILIIIFALSINLVAIDYQIENDELQRNLIVGELSCNNILIDVFKQSVDVTNELKKCEKKRKRR